MKYVLVRLLSIVCMLHLSSCFVEELQIDMQYNCTLCFTVEPGWKIAGNGIEVGGHNYPFTQVNDTLAVAYFDSIEHGEISIQAIDSVGKIDTFNTYLESDGFAVYVVGSKYLNPYDYFNSFPITTYAKRWTNGGTDTLSFSLNSSVTSTALNQKGSWYYSPEKVVLAWPDGVREEVFAPSIGDTAAASKRLIVVRSTGTGKDRFVQRLTILKPAAEIDFTASPRDSTLHLSLKKINWPDSLWFYATPIWTTDTTLLDTAQWNRSALPTYFYEGSVVNVYCELVSTDSSFRIVTPIRTVIFPNRAPQTPVYTVLSRGATSIRLAIAPAKEKDIAQYKLCYEPLGYNSLKDYTDTIYFDSVRTISSLNDTTVLTGMKSGTTYAIGLFAVDSSGLISPISSKAIATQIAGYDAVKLSAQINTGQSVHFSWKPFIGEQFDRYELRYSNSGTPTMTSPLLWSSSTVTDSMVVVDVPSVKSNFCYSKLFVIKGDSSRVESNVVLNYPLITTATKNQYGVRLDFKKRTHYSGVKLLRRTLPSGVFSTKAALLNGEISWVDSLTTAGEYEYLAIGYGTYTNDTSNVVTVMYP